MQQINLKAALTPNEAVNDLFDMGVACVKLPDDIIRASNEVLVEAYNFFSNPETIKEKFSSPNTLEGWREIGSELAPNTGRSDLSEAFTVWFRNARKPEVIDWAVRCPLHRSMTKLLNPCATFIEDLLVAIRCRLDPIYQSSNQVPVPIRDFSYLQINFSRPAKHTRDTIMDAHEDGHLLTLLRPFGTGLMIARGELVEAPTPSNPVGVFHPVGEFHSVVLNDNEALVIPSSPTFY
ncbi:hypothetical protein, partial [Nostoc commune]|uniref:hypothetical protein n=1 Tax=Nostoc commune TaxID=1178 RepID=UPI0011B29876